MRPWYATREAVKAALDVKETARNDSQVDRAVSSGSQAAEGALRRLFYPQVVTRSFPRPTGPDKVLVLEERGTEFISVTEILNNGTAVDSADYDLEPQTGPPYTRIRFGSSIRFVSPTTNRRPVSVEGVAGFDLVEPTAGQLAAAIGTTSTTTVDLGAAPTVGVGSLLRVGSERLLVAGRSMLTTSQTLQSPDLTASLSNTSVNVTDGTAYAVGEVLLVDAERMLVVDIAGNTLIVRRGWDGSVLAAHTAGATIYALRRLTVERGVLGTTAATHNQNDTVLRHEYPPSVVAYTVALAEDILLQEVTGQGYESEGHKHQRVLDRLRNEAMRAVGKKAVIG